MTEVDPRLVSALAVQLEDWRKALNEGAERVRWKLGERLQAGDRVITGSVVQVGVDPGDDVIADLEDLGSVRLTIAH